MCSGTCDENGECTPLWSNVITGWPRPSVSDLETVPGSYEISALLGANYRAGMTVRVGPVVVPIQPVDECATRIELQTPIEVVSGTVMVWDADGPFGLYRPLSDVPLGTVRTDTSPPPPAPQ
jgi:hypothetical protein